MHRSHNTRDYGNSKQHVCQWYFPRAELIVVISIMRSTALSGLFRIHGLNSLRHCARIRTPTINEQSARTSLTVESCGRSISQLRDYSRVIPARARARTRRRLGTETLSRMMSDFSGEYARESTRRVAFENLSINYPSSRGGRKKPFFLGLLKLLKESCGRRSSAGILEIVAAIPKSTTSLWLACCPYLLLPPPLLLLPCTLHTPGYRLYQKFHLEIYLNSSTYRRAYRGYRILHRCSSSHRGVNSNETGGACN